MAQLIRWLASVSVSIFSQDTCFCLCDQTDWVSSSKCSLRLTTHLCLLPRLRTCGAVPSLRLRVSGLQLRYRDSFTCNPLPFIHTASLLQSAETDVIALLYSEQQEDRSDRITACGRWSCLPQMGSLQLYLPSAAYVAWDICQVLSNTSTVVPRWSVSTLSTTSNSDKAG